MEINELAAIGHGLAAGVYSLLTMLMLSRWKDRPKAGLIAFAAGATAIWAALQALGSLGYLESPFILLLIEWTRNLAWLAVLVAIFRDIDVDRRAWRFAVRYGWVFFAATIATTAYYAVGSGAPWTITGVVGGGVAMSALILVLAEQVYRNAPFDAGSGLKYFCVGLAGIYAYDFVVFLLTVVNRELNVDQWAARGFVNVFFAVPLAFAAGRSFRLSLDRFMPRQFLIYSFALIGIGSLIVFALIGDYYIRTYGGTWGGVLRIVLVALAGFFVAVMFVSRTVRARVRVFVMKSFFQYKYDYRKEWLRFIGTLTESELDNVSATAVRAVAQIVNSPGGVVWIQEEHGKNYVPAGAWQCEIPGSSTVDRESPFVRFLERRQWVVDLNEVDTHPARYEGFERESWLSENTDWWLIVPLLLQNRLFGFIVMQNPRIAPTLNFEDHDLLRTVGRHVATHIDQAEADRRLAESSQFGTYNRLTAFLMHDLNNLIAQQSLVVKNAEKHRHNPEFVDDAIDTIANSVARMRRLMEQLSGASKQSEFRETDLSDVVARAVKRCEPRLPRPAVRFDGETQAIHADPDRLVTVLEHLIRNAQDATDDTGHIQVDLSSNAGEVVVCISDDGCGMSPEFIRERLFRPFDSTKGSQSMGIGAYQAREYVRQLGGQIDVSSTPGTGTRFYVRIPVHQDAG